jgi:hypothetical protein
MRVLPVDVIVFLEWGFGVVGLELQKVLWDWRCRETM